MSLEKIDDVTKEEFETLIKKIFENMMFDMDYTEHQTRIKVVKEITQNLITVGMKEWCIDMPYSFFYSLQLLNIFL